MYHCMADAHLLKQNHSIINKHHCYQLIILHVHSYLFIIYIKKKMLCLFFKYLVISPSCHQVAFVERALMRLIVWCMSSHFNTRTFAQAALVTIWSQASSRCPDILQRHTAMQAFIDHWNQERYVIK